MKEHIEKLVEEASVNPMTGAGAISVCMAAQAALPALKALLERQQWTANLLAVIHRDGGDYLGEHGWQKACEDGEKIVLELRNTTYKPDPPLNYEKEISNV